LLLTLLETGYSCHAESFRIDEQWSCLRCDRCQCLYWGTGRGFMCL